MTEEIIQLTEHDEERWHQYLEEFERDVWPLFERRGYTKDGALCAWLLNNVKNALHDVQDALRYD